jgi:hypothetical protein
LPERLTLKVEVAELMKTGALPGERKLLATLLYYCILLDEQAGGTE